MKFLGLIFWLLIIPVGLGLLFRKVFKQERLPERMRTLGITLLIGYILMFALLEVTGIPVMLLSVYHGYSRLVWIYAILLVLLAGAGYVLTGVRRKQSGKLGQEEKGQLRNRLSGHASDIGADGIEGKILFGIFILLVGFQLYMAYTRASFDGDDAYYVVQALTAQQTDTLYRIDPNRGVSMPLDARHALALFPIWEAFIGTMCGMHATIVAHSVAPLILIPLTYLIYYEIGKELFIKKKNLIPMFLALMALWQMFGNVSIYTTETFFLTRTWQGKSFAGNFIIPAVFWIFLCLFREWERADAGGSASGSVSVSAGSDAGDGKGRDIKGMSLWLLLALLNLAAGASSSLAVLLSCALTVGLGVLLMIRSRKFKNLVYAGLSCVLGGAYVLLYLML